MNLRQLLEDGVSPGYLEHWLGVERYAWLALSYDMACVVDMEGRMEDLNQRWERDTGHSLESLRSKYLIEFMHVEEREKKLFELQRLITSDMGMGSFDMKFLCHDGSFKRQNWSVLYSPDHERYFCVVKDVSELAAEREAGALASQAYRDALTGLYNRLYLTDALPNLLVEATRTDGQVAAMFLDLDGFKKVNDTLGHRAGDELLRQVGETLTWCLEGPGFAARYGGDEFMLVLTGPNARERTEATARRIQVALQTPIVLDGEEVVVGASMGIATAPPAESYDALFEAADAAMYEAKRQGKGGYRLAEQVPPGQDD